MTLVMLERIVPGLVTRPTTLRAEEYPFSSLSALDRHLRWLVDYAGCGDIASAARALRDLDAVRAELGEQDR